MKLDPIINTLSRVHETCITISFIVHISIYDEQDGVFNEHVRVAYLPTIMLN